MLFRSLPLSARAARLRLQGALSTIALSLPPGAFGRVPPLHDDRPRISVPIATPRTHSQYRQHPVGGIRSLPTPALSGRHGVLSSPAPTRGAGSSSRTWKHAAGHLDLGPDAPPGNEGARERRIREIDRDRVVQDPAYSRGRQRPAIRAAILVEPGGDLSMAPAETSGWNRKPDADGKVRPAVVIISRGLPGICEFLVCSNPRIAHRVRSV